MDVPMAWCSPRSTAVWMAAVLIIAGAARGEPAAGTAPQWTDRPGRNRVSPAKGLPERLKDATLLWHEETGAQSNFGIPATIRGRRMLIGMARSGVKDHGRWLNGAIVCYDIRTGERLWQTQLPCRGYGLCCSPTVEGRRVYVQGGMAMCLDLLGQANGNDGPFTDEAAATGRRGKELLHNDADVLWVQEVFDPNVKLFAHHGHAGTPLVVGDQLWVPTSYAHGRHHMNIHLKTQKLKLAWDAPDPYKVPWRPNVKVLDKHTGRVIAHDTVRQEEVFHGCWSSLSSGVVDGRRLVLWGDGYGVLHAFAVPQLKPGEVVELEEVWRYDANPHAFRFDSDGEPISFPYLPWRPQFDAAVTSPNYIIAAAVFHGGKVYLATGRDYNYDGGKGGRRGGAGTLHCIDPRGRGDITKTGRVWMRTDVGRCTSTGAVTDDGLLFVSDNRGDLHCYDAATGEKHWAYDLGGHTFYCAPLVADGRVYVGTFKGDMYVFRAADRPDVISRTRLDAAVCAPSAVDGLLVVPTWKSVYVFAGPGYEGSRPDKPAGLIAGYGPAEHEDRTARRPAKPAGKTTLPDRTDWPRFRGPAGNGLARGLPEAWQPDAAWRAEVGGAVYAGAAVDGGVVYTLAHEQGVRDRLRTFDARTGRALAEAAWPNRVKDMDYGAAPRATPLLAGGRVYTLAANGVVQARQAGEVGKLLWQVDLIEDLGAELPTWGFSSNPVLVDRRLIVNPGAPGAAFVALDARSGKVLWKAAGAKANYAGFAVRHVSGRKRVIGIDAKHVVSLDAETGKRIWWKPLPPNPGYIVPAPIVTDAGVLIGTEAGIYLQPWGGEGELPPRWPVANEEFDTGSATAVVLDEMVLGLAYDRGLTALSLRGGLQRRWTFDGPKDVTGYGTLIAGDGRVLVFTRSGTIYLFEVNPRGARLLGSSKLTAETLAAPALADGAVYLRAGTKLHKLRLTPPPPGGGPEGRPPAAAPGASRPAGEWEKISDAVLEQAPRALKGWHGSNRFGGVFVEPGGRTLLAVTNGVEGIFASADAGGTWRRVPGSADAHAGQPQARLVTTPSPSRGSRPSTASLATSSRSSPRATCFAGATRCGCFAADTATSSSPTPKRSCWTAGCTAAGRSSSPRTGSPSATTSGR